jgi:transcriptional regulator with XRE-family HTH domain
MSCEYPKDLKTLGDHVRKRRLDLGLNQKTTGQRMGVHGGTVWNWESGQRKPETKNLPAIIAFLGYNPIPAPAAKQR